MEHNKRRVAALIRRAPWIGYGIQRIWRIWQPWVTVGAVGAIFNDAGQLLVVEHVFHPRFPWGLPGGWSARHEDPNETVRREVQEETGLRIAVLKPLLVAHAHTLANHLDVGYLCHAPQDAGDIRLSDELLDYRWVDPADCPPVGMFNQRVIDAAVAERAVAEQASAAQAEATRLPRTV